MYNQTHALHLRSRQARCQRGKARRLVLGGEFEWETAFVVVDSRKTYGEPRFRALGLIGERVHAMVFSLRDTSVRIISLRRANKREVRMYEDQG